MRRGTVARHGVDSGVDSGVESDHGKKNEPPNSRLRAGKRSFCEVLPSTTAIGIGPVGEDLGRGNSYFIMIMIMIMN